MSTELIKAKENAVMTPAERRAALVAKMKERKQEGTMPTHRSSAVFAGWDGNSGGLTYGRDKNPVPEDQKFVVVVDEAEHGCVLWEGGSVKDRRLTKVIDGPAIQPPPGEPKAGDLPKPRERDGWTDTIKLTFVGIDGGDLDGVQIEFDLSNKSKLGSATELLASCFEQLETPEGERGIVNPIVTVETNSYYNKGYSRDVFFPEFKILEWTDGEERIPAVQLSEEEGVSVLD